MKKIVRKEITPSQCEETPMFEIPRSSFRLLAYEISMDFDSDIRFSKQALEALQEETEKMMVDLFRDANLCAFHRMGRTLEVKDILLAKVLNRDISHWSAYSGSLGSHNAYFHHDMCLCIWRDITPYCEEKLFEEHCRKICVYDKIADKRFQDIMRKNLKL